MTTFLILAIMVAVFFCGRYSIILRIGAMQQKVVQAQIKKHTLPLLKELLPTKVILNCTKGTARFDKPTPFPIKIEFEDEEILSDLHLRGIDSFKEMKAELEKAKKKADTDA